MYPKAEVRTKNHRGQPVVLAVESCKEGADVIRLIHFTELAPRQKPSRGHVTP
jgi:hypothetical protein